MTAASKKADMTLEQIPYLNSTLYFQKNTADVEALINSSSKVTAIISTYAEKLDFKIFSTNVKASKINGSIFYVFRIVLASF